MVPRFIAELRPLILAGPTDLQERKIIMENLGTIWVCVDCMLHHANGECGGCHEGHDEEPLSAIEASQHVAMGMARDEHECNDDENGIEYGECDCETNTYSTSQCEGCGSYLHGERHAMTLFAPDQSADSTRSCGCGGTGTHGVDHGDYDNDPGCIADDPDYCAGTCKN